MSAAVNHAWIIDLVFKGRWGGFSRWDGRPLGRNQTMVVNITDAHYSHTKDSEGKPKSEHAGFDLEDPNGLVVRLLI